MLVSSYLKLAASETFVGSKFEGSKPKVIGKVVSVWDPKKSKPVVYISFKKDVVGVEPIKSYGRKLSATVRQQIAKRATAPKSPLIGEAQIGVGFKQESYSDDSYLLVKANTHDLAALLIGIVKKIVPTGGGHVNKGPGYSYKGSGVIDKLSDTEYAYHYESFGIGD